MEKIALPEDVRYILNTLHNNGYEAFIVGGCVRDALMGRVPHDYDITTNALPQEVKKIFRKHHVIETGIKHGTVTVMLNKEPYEITTYRYETTYSDHRHPDEVIFSPSLKEDLIRRDFTINAMAYNEKDGLIDYYEGRNDLAKGIIRCVGEAEKRFEEDALRILRALRFKTRFGFVIEETTEKAMFDKMELLRFVSSERVVKEFDEIICGNDIADTLIRYADIIAVFLPDIKPMFHYDQNNVHHIHDLWTHTVEVVRNTDNDLYLRYAALFHDIGKPQCKSVGNDGQYHFYGHEKVSSDMTRHILKQLHCDNKRIDAISKLIYYHDYPLDSDRQIRRLLSNTGFDLFTKILQLKKADNLAQNPEYLKSDDYYSDILSKARRFNKENSAPSLKELKLDGNDLKQLGLSGEDIGKTLQKALDAVLDGNIHNEHEEIMSYLKNKGVIK